jgi:TRAP-type C4-dicarboxylate transport system substrate-binding protein
MRKLIGLFVASVVLISFSTVRAHGETIVIKGVTAFPKNHTNVDPVQLFIDRVNKRAAGRLKIEWLGGPEVVQTFDQIHALKAGTIEMLLYYPFGYMKPLMPECWAKGLSRLSAWEERKSGAHDLWEEIFAKRVNAKYIGQFDSFHDLFE